MKDVKKLFIPLAILGVLILALVIYLVTDAVRKNSLEEQLKSKSYSVFEMESLKEMKIDSADGESIVFGLDGTNKIDSCTHDGNPIPVDQLDVSAINDYISYFSNISIVRDVSSEDSSAAGLDKDSYTLTVTQKDGKTNVLHFGKALADESGVFFRLDNNDKISIVKYYYYQKLITPFENLLNIRVISLEKAYVSDITLSRLSRNDKIVVSVEEEKNTSLISTITYKVKEPVVTNPKAALVSLMDKFLDFQVSKYLNISKEQYPSYGLDKPEYTITVRRQNGEMINVYLSREFNGMYYGYCSNSSVTFQIVASYLPELNLPISDLFDTYIRRGYLDTIRSATVNIEDKQFTFDIYLEKETKDIFHEQSKLSLNGRDARVISGDGQNCYGLLVFESLFNIQYSMIDKEATPELKDPAASILVQTVNGSFYSLKFVKRDADTYYCFVDDEYSGFIVDRSVLYRDNGQYLSGFGIWDAYNLCNEAISNQDIDGIYDRPKQE